MTTPIVSVRGRIGGIYQGFAYERLTITTAAATGLTSTVFAPADTARAQSAIVTVENSDVRYRYDGSSPTSTDGSKLYEDGVLTLMGYHNINQCEFINVGTTTDASVVVSYER